MNLSSLALAGEANTDGRAPVISLILKIRIDYSLCIDSVTLLHHKTIKKNTIWPCILKLETQQFTICVDMGDFHCLKLRNIADVWSSLEVKWQNVLLMLHYTLPWDKLRDFLRECNNFFTQQKNWCADTDEMSGGWHLIREEDVSGLHLTI